jgi:nitrate/TMAO reductase-like tetraheme cytochrome c subunit
MKVRQRLRAFFSPPPGSRLWRRLLPWGTLLVVLLGVSFTGVTAWEYTNSPEFCGTTCHTMPPEYTAYLTSPHARILCVECHIGRDFIGSRVLRKAGDIRHVVATMFETYDFPIRAEDMRPARETCERCHSPEKFSDDSLREIKHFEPDKNNTPYSIFLTLKTGGGSKRQGLGRGIHWHIENPIFFLPSDPEEQTIPYVRVVEDDGSFTEFVDVSANFDRGTLNESALEEMDCITCHNRITHLIARPEDSVDQLLALGTLSSAIPEIRLKSVQVMSAPYGSQELALNGIAGLRGYYQVVYPDFYAANTELIDSAIAVLQDVYTKSVFLEQKADWNSHADNVGHKYSPGCFRCHDGKHLTSDGEAIRLECNLCHSIPVVAGMEDFVVDIEISRGPEPASHLNTNWITLHRDAFNPTCANCHTTEDPGGTSNTSFCSNSGCHGQTWEYAGFDAPGLREQLQSQLPPPPTPEPTPPGGSALTFEATIGALFETRCIGCHGQAGLQGLNLTTYQAALAGSDNGPVIVPGDPDASLLVKKQSGEQPHFGQLTPDELDRVIEWIAAGAPEK